MASLDVAHHIISDEGLREPDSYADAFVVLAENGVISVSDAKTYRLMAQFRNKIIHYYEKVDPEQVFAGHLGDFEVYAQSVRKWTCHAVSLRRRACHAVSLRRRMIESR